MSNEGSERRLSVVALEFEQAAIDLQSLIERIRFSARLASLAEDFDRISKDLQENISRLKSILEDADESTNRE